MRISKNYDVHPQNLITSGFNPNLLINLFNSASVRLASKVRPSQSGVCLTSAINFRAARSGYSLPDKIILYALVGLTARFISVFVIYLVGASRFQKTGMTASKMMLKITAPSKTA